MFEKCSNPLLGPFKDPYDAYKILMRNLFFHGLKLGKCEPKKYRLKIAPILLFFENQSWLFFRIENIHIAINVQNGMKIS